MKNSKLVQRKKRHARVRARTIGSAKKPRLVVYRSLKYTSAQLVDDTARKVLIGMTDKTLKTKGVKTERAKALGKALAEKATAKGITTCVFDRGGYKYHGRVKAVADGAREGGLKF